MADQKKVIFLESRMLGLEHSLSWLEDSLFNKERLAIFILMCLPKYAPFCLGFFTFSSVIHLLDFNLRKQYGSKSPSGKYDGSFWIARVAMIFLALHYQWGAFLWYMAMVLFALSNMLFIVKHKNLLHKIVEPASMTSNRNPKIEEPSYMVWFERLAVILLAAQPSHTYFWYTQVALLAVPFIIVHIILPDTLLNELARDANKGNKESTDKVAKERAFGIRQELWRKCCEGNNHGGGHRRVKECNSLARQEKFAALVDKILFLYERIAILALMFPDLISKLDLCLFMIDVLICLLCFLIIEDIKLGITGPSFLFWLERAAIVLLASYKIDGTKSSLYSAAILFVFTNFVYIINSLPQMLKDTTRSKELEKEEERAKLELQRLKSENVELKKELVEAAENFEQKILEAIKESQAVKEDKRNLEAEIENLNAKLNDVMEEAEETDYAMDGYQQLVCNLENEKNELKKKLNQYEQGDNLASSSNHDQRIQQQEEQEQLLEELRGNGDKCELEIKDLRAKLNLLTSVSEHDQAALFSLEEQSQNWLNEREQLVTGLDEIEQSQRIWIEEKENWEEEREQLIGALAELDENQKVLKKEKENWLEERMKLIRALAENTTKWTNEKKDWLEDREELIRLTSVLEKQQKLLKDEKAKLEAQLAASESWHESYFSKANEYIEASLKWEAEKKSLVSDLYQVMEDKASYETRLLASQEKCSKLEKDVNVYAQKLKDMTMSAELYKEVSQVLQKDNNELKEAVEAANLRTELYRYLLRDLDSCPNFE